MEANGSGTDRLTSSSLIRGAVWYEIAGTQNLFAGLVNGGLEAQCISTLKHNSSIFSNYFQTDGNSTFQWQWKKITIHIKQ